jgi:hypothetical protein
MRAGLGTREAGMWRWTVMKHGNNRRGYDLLESEDWHLVSNK